MALDFAIERTRPEVETAIVQFCARRSYRLTQPWYLDGLRIEAAVPSEPAKSDGSFEGKLSEVWNSLTDMGGGSKARIDITLGEKKTRTKIKIAVGDHPGSVKLAYELHTYLLDERAYEHDNPAQCPKCGSPVANVIAKYCGRCGVRLKGDWAMSVPPRIIPPPPIVKVERANEAVGREEKVSEIYSARPFEDTLSESANAGRTVEDEPIREQFESSEHGNVPEAEQERDVPACSESEKAPSLTDEENAQERIEQESPAPTRSETPRKKLLAED